MSSPQLRLRQALATSTGSRIVVARADLEELLDNPPLPRPEPARGVPTPRRAPAIEVSRGERVVALTATTEDAKRLARAAWESNPKLVAEHGPWEDADPGLTWHTVKAAEQTLRALIHPADHA